MSVSIMLVAIFVVLAATRVPVAVADPTKPPTIVVGTTTLHMCSPTVIRVTKAPGGKQVEKTSLMAKSDWEPFKYVSTR